jgi:hypothetical protein
MNRTLPIAELFPVRPRWLVDGGALFSTLFSTLKSVETTRLINVLNRVFHKRFGVIRT